MMTPEQIERYVDLRIEEFKLKSAVAVSDIVSSIIVAIVAAVAVMALLVFLAYVSMVWIDGRLGQPWGAVISGGVFLLLIIVFIALRKRFLSAPLASVLSSSLGISSSDPSGEMAAVEREIALCKEESDAEIADLSEQISSGIRLAVSSYTLIKAVGKIFKK